MNIPVLGITHKQLMVGAVVALFGVYAASQFLPGLAARVGVRPRPAFPTQQNNWYEPFGLRPWIPSMSGGWATPSAIPTSTTQMQSDLSSVAGALVNITGAGGTSPSMQ